MKILFLAAVAVFAAWVAGVRIHPAMVDDYYQVYLKNDYRKIQFRNGREVTGEFVSERGGRVRLKAGGQTVSYPVHDIERMKQIGPVEIYQAMKEGKIPMPGGETLFSFRREDGLFAGKKPESRG